GDRPAGHQVDQAVIWAGLAHPVGHQDDVLVGGGAAQHLGEPGAERIINVRPAVGGQGIDNVLDARGAVPRGDLLQRDRDVRIYVEGDDAQVVLVLQGEGDGEIGCGLRHQDLGLVACQVVHTSRAVEDELQGDVA